MAAPRRRASANRRRQARRKPMGERRRRAGGRPGAEPGLIPRCRPTGTERPRLRRAGPGDAPRPPPARARGRRRAGQRRPKRSRPGQGRAARREGKHPGLGRNSASPGNGTSWKLLPCSSSRRCWVRIHAQSCSCPRILGFPNSARQNSGVLQGGMEMKSQL